MFRAMKVWSSAAFRVYFLAAGLFAVATLLVWELYLGVHALGGLVSDMPFAMAPHHWHAHELIFGYGGSAMAGFLLTAVANWTGAPAPGRGFVLVSAAIWALGRVAIWVSAGLPWQVVALADLAWLPLIWAGVARMLWRDPKARNTAFLGFIALYWLGNLATHLGWAGVIGDDGTAGLHAGLMSLAGMVLVIGGRVTPAFTRNAMLREGASGAQPRDIAWLAPVMLVAAALVPLAALVLPGRALSAGLAVAVGLAGLVRQARWGLRFAARRPILGIMHLSVALVGLGLVLTGLARFTGLSEVAGLHLLAIGGVGGMTLAMMSRATLGHAGRALVAGPGLALAYGALPLAAALRWAASTFHGAVYYPATLTAGALWIFAFCAFVAVLWPVFFAARPGAPDAPPPGAQP